MLKDEFLRCFFFFSFLFGAKKNNPVTKFLTPPLVSKRKEKCNAPCALLKAVLNFLHTSLLFYNQSFRLNVLICNPFLSFFLGWMILVSPHMPYAFLDVVTSNHIKGALLISTSFYCKTSYCTDV